MAQTPPPGLPQPPAKPETPAADSPADAKRRQIERGVFERRKPPEADNPVETPKPLGES